MIVLREHIPVGIVVGLDCDVAVRLKLGSQLAVNEAELTQIAPIFLAGIVSAVDPTEQIEVHLVAAGAALTRHIIVARHRNGFRIAFAAGGAGEGLDTFRGAGRLGGDNAAVVTVAVGAAIHRQRNIIGKDLSVVGQGQAGVFTLGIRGDRIALGVGEHTQCDRSILGHITFCIVVNLGNLAISFRLAHRNVQLVTTDDRIQIQTFKDLDIHTADRRILTVIVAVLQGNLGGRNRRRADGAIQPVVAHLGSGTAAGNGAVTGRRVDHAESSGDGIDQIRFFHTLQDLKGLRASVSDGFVAGTGLVFIDSQLKAIQHIILDICQLLLLAANPVTLGGHREEADTAVALVIVDHAGAVAEELDPVGHGVAVVIEQGATGNTQITPLIAGVFIHVILALDAVPVRIIGGGALIESGGAVSRGAAELRRGSFQGCTGSGHTALTQDPQAGITLVAGAIDTGLGLNIRLTGVTNLVVGIHQSVAGRQTGANFHGNSQIGLSLSGSPSNGVVQQDIIGLIMNDHVTARILQGSDLIEADTARRDSHAGGRGLIAAHNVGNNGPALILKIDGGGSIGIHTGGGVQFRITGHAGRKIIRRSAEGKAHGFRTLPIDSARFEILLHGHVVIDQCRPVGTAHIHTVIHDAVGSEDTGLSLGEQEHIGLGHLCQLGVGIMAMVGNQHHVGLQHIRARIDLQHQLIYPVHIAVQNSRQVLGGIGDLIGEGDLQNRAGIVEVTVVIGCGSRHQNFIRRVIRIDRFEEAFFTVGAVTAAMVGILALAVQMVNDHFLTVGGGIEAILLGINHIKLHAGNVEALAGMGLIILDAGELSAEQLQKIRHIPGGAQTLTVDVVHHALKLDLIVVVIHKAGKALKMVGMGMGQEPGVDDNLLPFALAGHFPQEGHKAVAGLIVPLLLTAAIIDEQAIIGHPNDDQGTAVDLVGLVVGAAGVDVVAVFCHRKAVHDHHGLCSFAGGALIHEAIGIHAGHIGIGIYNDANLIQGIENVHIDNVRTIHCLITAIGNGVGVSTYRAVRTVFIHVDIVRILGHFDTIGKEMGVIRIHSNLKIGFIGTGGHNAITAIIFQPGRYRTIGISQFVQSGFFKIRCSHSLGFSQRLDFLYFQRERNAGKIRQ